MVNNDIWDNYAKEGIAMISKKLTEKYGKPISEEQAKKWRKVYEMAKNIDVPMLRFSDNPFSDKSSKHGLWGIGKSYTWLKMSQTPNLESVRQALISYDMRVRKDVECSNIPDKQPDKPRLETELLDIESQISKYEKSGISDTLKEKQLFDDQEKALLSYIDRKKNKIDEIKKYLDEVVIAYDDVTDSEIKSLLEEDLNEFKLDINRLNQFCNEMLSKNDKLFEKVDNTEWKKKRIAIQNKYVSVMQNLQDNGLDTVKLDTLMEQRNNKKEEIDRILIKEKQLCKENNVFTV